MFWDNNILMVKEDRRPRVETNGDSCGPSNDKVGFNHNPHFQKTSVLVLFVTFWICIRFCQAKLLNSSNFISSHQAILGRKGGVAPGVSGEQGPRQTVRLQGREPCQGMLPVSFLVMK